MKEGDKVRYTPVIGGNHDGKVYTVKSIHHKNNSNQTIVFLEEKSGYVVRRAVYRVEEEIINVELTKDELDTLEESLSQFHDTCGGEIDMTGFDSLYDKAYKLRFGKD